MKNDREKTAEKWAEKQAKKRLEQVNKRREAKKETGASSSRKLDGRHRVCIARSKVARELLKTQEELRRRERQLQQQKVLTAKYRQRLHRTMYINSISNFIAITWN